MMFMELSNCRPHKDPTFSAPSCQESQCIEGALAQICLLRLTSCPSGPQENQHSEPDCPALCLPLHFYLRPDSQGLGIRLLDTEGCRRLSPCAAKAEQLAAHLHLARRCEYVEIRHIKATFVYTCLVPRF